MRGGAPRVERNGGLRRRPDDRPVADAARSGSTRSGDARRRRGCLLGRRWTVPPRPTGWPCTGGDGQPHRRRRAHPRRRHGLADQAARTESRQPRVGLRRTRRRPPCPRLRPRNTPTCSGRSAGAAATSASSSEFEFALPDVGPRRTSACSSGASTTRSPRYAMSRDVDPCPARRHERRWSAAALAPHRCRRFRNSTISRWVTRLMVVGLRLGGRRTPAQSRRVR